MNKKLFRRDGREAQLRDLYRQAEQGGEAQGVSPDLRKAFAQDQQLIQQIDHVARSSPATNSVPGRATFLAAVARQRSESLREDRITMIGRRVGARGLALLAAAGIFVGGAVTVGASGGVTDASGNANDVLATLHVPHKSHGHGQGNSNAGNKPEGIGTPGAEGTARAVEGIPTENPQHHPADNNGTCDKGETVVKTTPSGVSVNVPCQAAEDHGHGAGEGNADKTREPDDTPDADETQEAGETPEGQGDQGHGRAAAHGHDDKTPEPEETEQPD